MSACRTLQQENVLLRLLAQRIGASPDDMQRPRRQLPPAALRAPKAAAAVSWNLSGCPPAWQKMTAPVATTTRPVSLW